MEFKPNPFEHVKAGIDNTEDTKARIAKRKKAKSKSNLKTAATMAGVSLLTAAAVAGCSKAAEQKSDLPDNRFTPERAAAATPKTEAELGLTPEQLAAKHAQDAAEREKELAKVREALKPAETPKTVTEQNFDGLDTSKIE